MYFGWGHLMCSHSLSWASRFIFRKSRQLGFGGHCTGLSQLLLWSFQGLSLLEGELLDLLHHNKLFTTTISSALPIGHFCVCKAHLWENVCPHMMSQGPWKHCSTASAGLLQGMLCKHQWLLFFLCLGQRESGVKRHARLSAARWARWQSLSGRAADSGPCSPPHPMENRQMCLCACRSHQLSWWCWQPKRQLEGYFSSGTSGNIRGGMVDRSLKEAAAVGTLAWAHALERHLESSGDMFSAPLPALRLSQHLLPSCAHWPLARRGLRFTSKDT